MDGCIQIPVIKRRCFTHIGHPLPQELRVKGSYLHHKEIKAAQGIKIAANGLESAVAGAAAPSKAPSWLHAVCFLGVVSSRHIAGGCLKWALEMGRNVLQGEAEAGTATAAVPRAAAQARSCWWWGRATT